VNRGRLFFGDFLLAMQKKVTSRRCAPDSDSRSVEREGARAAEGNIMKRGAHAAAPAPQAALTVSRQPTSSRRFIRAVRFGAVGVDVKRMLVNGEAAFLGDFGLTALDFGVEKLFHTPALHAH
jgi:hypothetical protein